MSRFSPLAVSITVFVSAVTSPTLAAEPAAPVPVPTPEALDCAARYGAAVHMEKTMVAMIEGFMPTIMARFDREELSDKVKALFLESAIESAIEFTPKIMDRIVPVMAASFTEAEICGLADFYESDIGQSITSKMPAYTAAASEPMATLIPEFQADILARFCSKFDCKNGRLLPSDRNAS